MANPPPVAAQNQLLFGYFASLFIRPHIMEIYSDVIDTAIVHDDKKT